MFTGLVSDVGRVRAVREAPGEDLRAEIETAYDMTEIPIGASIACSGVCLTVVDKGTGGRKNWFAVDLSPETRAVTSLGAWKEGSTVNLERSVRVGEELGGHIVLGHVDGTGKLESATPKDGSHGLRIAMPKSLAPFIASKGSIAVDGVSLTVNAVSADYFEVNIIPHTWSHTAFAKIKPGDPLNLEVDVLARYVARLKEMPH